MSVIEKTGEHPTGKILEIIQGINFYLELVNELSLKKLEIKDKKLLEKVKEIMTDLLKIMISSKVSTVEKMSFNNHYLLTSVKASILYTKYKNKRD